MISKKSVVVATLETISRPSPTPGCASRPTPAWKVFLAGVAIVLAGVAAYGNSLRGAMVLDDGEAIQKNQSIQQGWREAWQPPAAGSPVTGRPLVNLSFALNYHLSGLSLPGYHATNLAIHLLAALALFGLVRRTLALPILHGRHGANALPLALSVAMLWMLHPLQTESVTYLSQRAESLMGLFYLLTLYGLARSAQSAHGWWWQGCAVAACLLGMLSKEVMVTAPVLALLYDRTFMAGSFARAWQQRWKLYLALGCTWLPLAMLVEEGGNRGHSVGYGLGVHWWQYAWQQSRVVAQYLQLSIWPNPLALYYGVALPKAHFAAFLDAGMMTILIAATLIALKWKPGAGFAGAWFFGILAPTSSVVPIVTEPMALHRMYLPLAGLVVLAVFGFREIWRSRAWGSALAVGLVLAVLAHTRNSQYQSAISIWQDNAAKLPELAAPHKDLALALYAAGRKKEALAEDAAALRLNPGDAMVEYNFGLQLSGLGRFAEALAHLQRAVALDPANPEARALTGITLLKLGRVPDAVAEFQEVLRLEPGSPEGQINLGNAYNYSGQPDVALRYYQTAAQSEPNSPDAHFGLANTFILLGRFDEAIRESKECLRLKPDDPVNHYELGLAYSKSGRLAEALAQYKVAVAAAPDFVAAREALRSLQERMQGAAAPLAPQ